MHQGEPLVDTAMAATVDAPMDLQLVLLPFVDASPVQVEAIIKEASRGRASVLEAMLSLPIEPDVADASLHRPLVWAVLTS